MRESAVRAVRELKAIRVSLLDDEGKGFIDSDLDEGSLNESNTTKGESTNNPLINSEEYERLTAGLQKRAEHYEGTTNHERKDSGSFSESVSLHDFINESVVQGKTEGMIDTRLQQQAELKTTSKVDSQIDDVKNAKARDATARRSSKDRFANKVLGRLYNGRAFATGLVFSRGHFLGDIEKMVEGLLSSANEDAVKMHEIDFDDMETVASRETLTIFEKEGGQHTSHTSTLAAGKDGCLVMVLPKSSLTPFLDQYPGLLLSLLGTQVVV